MWTSDGAGAGVWKEPAGGEEWEEVDLSNFPTDWVNGDTIRYWFKPREYKITASSWTSSVSHGALETSGAVVRQFEGVVSGEYCYFESIMSTTKYVAILRYALPPVRDLNSGMASIFAQSTFNGSYMVHTDLAISTSNNNISSFISRMWRKRAK